MDDRPDRCVQCGLPLPVRARLAFCCYGCQLAHELAGATGAEGEARLLMIRLGIALFLAMSAMAFSFVIYGVPDTGEPGSAAFLSLVRYFLLAVSTPVMVLLGFPILRSSLRDLRRSVLGMDALIVVGTFTAYLVSVWATVAERREIYFDTATMVLVLVTLGRYLEARSRARAGEVITTLRASAPERALVVDGSGGEREIDARAVAPGAHVRVRAGTVVPVDGRVVRGEGATDESSLTGEAEPVWKTEGSELLAGTTLVDGELVAAATRVGEERAIVRLAALLETARAARTPAERAADRIAGILVPVFIALAGVVTLGWWAHAGFGRGLLAGLSVLLVACPCALGIATPLAVWAGLAAAARRGIVVRDGGVFEDLARVRAVAFDKTGTLSAKRMELAAVWDEEGALDRDRAFARHGATLAAAAALEAGVEHPVARSLRAAAAALGRVLPAPTAVRPHPGLGVEGDFERPEGAAGERLAIGSALLMARLGASVSPALAAAAGAERRRGRTVVLVAAGGSVRLVLAFLEEPRPGAAEALAALAASGLVVSVLSGDSREAVQVFAERLGIAGEGGLRPEEKVEAIARLERAVGPTAMVGDGVNDAPALARATVGIALGAGADLTREAADVSLLGDDLRQVSWLVAHARRVAAAIRRNLAWAFGYNAIAVGLAAAGLLTPVLAALVMIGSSLLVAGRALRLEREP
jgi:Cu2+-exporting ATPase